MPGLEALVSASRTPGESGAARDQAFQVWQGTALARYPVTSSVEVYGPDGRLLSRFAFNLPEDLSQVSRSDEAACAWTVAEEVAPFFADDRRVYHAGRALCRSGGASAGSRCGTRSSSQWRTSKPSGSAAVRYSLVIRLWCGM